MRLSRLNILFITLIAITTPVAFLIEFSRQGDLQTALWIFVISLFGFSILAFMSWDCIRAWRAVDYLWVFSSFVAIMISLQKIRESERLDLLAARRQELVSAFSQLNYQGERVFEAGCTGEKPVFVLRITEISQQGCARLGDFLPQMQYQIQNVDQYVNIWGKEFEEHEFKNFFQTIGQQFDSSLTSYVAAKNANPPPSGLASIVIGTKAKNWYYILAFLVGLRLSRTTSELMQATLQKKAKN